MAWSKEIAQLFQQKQPGANIDTNAVQRSLSAQMAERLDDSGNLSHYFTERVSDDRSGSGHDEHGRYAGEYDVANEDDGYDADNEADDDDDDDDGDDEDDVGDV
ncbi:hypothetical protein APHAL10511_005699 [Amanita phalloides]|nr:hypothetical protein APHAL10511_005699 [Amanita phalloides]